MSPSRTERMRRGSRRTAAPPRTSSIAAIALALCVLGSAQAGATTSATLVSVIATSTWTPASPDASGIAYRPTTGRLLVVDSEVDETPLWQHANVWNTGTDGVTKMSWSTERFSREPSGIAITGKDTVWLSDDSLDHIIRWRPGPDERWGTADDVVIIVPSSAYGSDDPEDLSLGGGSLYIADGESTDIIRVQRGPNGRFDLEDPPGDDIVTRFDTSTLGLTEPEGVTYDAASDGLYLVSRREDVIVHATIDGALLASIDISAFHVNHLSGIAVAPSSDPSSPTTVYVTDRGVDNDVNPAENDGRILSFTLATT